MYASTGRKLLMETASDRYIRLQNQCGFTKGDYVKVIGKASSYQFGWLDCWTSAMDDSVGKHYRILSISNTGIVLRIEDKISYNFPFFVLESFNKTNTSKKELEDLMSYKPLTKKELANVVETVGKRMLWGTSGKTEDKEEKEKEEERFSMEEAKKLNIPRI